MSNFTEEKNPFRHALLQYAEVRKETHKWKNIHFILVFLVESRSDSLHAPLEKLCDCPVFTGGFLRKLQKYQELRKGNPKLFFWITLRPLIYLLWADFQQVILVENSGGCRVLRYSYYLPQIPQSLVAKSFISVIDFWA